MNLKVRTMNIPLPSARSIALALASVFTVACSGNNPLFCDLRNACVDEERSFCDIDQAYPGTTLANECIARPSAEACNRAQPCSDPEKKACTGEDKGVCVACTKNIDCDGSLNCDPRTNECTTDTIINCDPLAGDAQCAEASEELPYCAADAVCVGCLSDDNCQANLAAAICDEVDFTCRGCIANSECDSRVCDDGTCADETDIVYVSTAVGTDGVSCGTTEAPCKTIGGGIEQVAGTRDTVLIAEGTYAEKIVLASRVLNLRGEGEVLVRSTLGSSEQVLTVSGISMVDVRDMTFQMLAAPSSADMVRCSDATTRLELHNVVIDGADDIGVVGENCDLAIFASNVGPSGGVGIEMTDGTLTLHASEVHANGEGGVDIDGSNFSIVNNFIYNNGGPASVTGGLRIESTSSQEQVLAYNTIAQNSRVSGAGIGSALRCEVTSVVATNNIFMLEEASSAELVSGCSTEYSLFDADSTMPVGAGNLSGEALFADAPTRNFHLSPGSPGIDAALPIVGIESDYDGDPRPAGDGPDMGADEAE